MLETTRDPSRPKVRLGSYTEPIHVDVTEFLKENEGMKCAIIKEDPDEVLDVIQKNSKS